MLDFQGSEYQDYLDIVGSDKQFTQPGRCWKCGLETTTSGIYCGSGYCKLLNKNRKTQVHNTFAHEANEHHVFECMKAIIN